MTRRKAAKKLFDDFNPLLPHLPSTQEEASARELLAEAVNSTSLVRKKMAKARSEPHLATLRESLESALLKETRIRAFLAPIRRIPEEILSEILQYAYNIGVSPWNFTQVSRFFRATAFNTPRIWNRVKYLPNAVSSRNSSGFEMCRTWSELQEALLRSKGVPLDLEISLYSSDKSLILVNGIQYPSSILDPVADRLASLVLYWSISAAYTTRIVTQPLKSLQKLDISGGMDPIAFRDLMDVVDATAHNLWKLKLGHIADTLSPDLSLWSRIADLETSGNTSPSILLQLLNVHTLHLHRDIDLWSSSLPSVTLSRLETANIRNPHIFFSHVFAPILRVLQVTGKFISLSSSAPIRLPSLERLEITSSPTIYTDFCVAPLLKSMKMSSGGTILGRNPNQILKEPDIASSMEKLELDSVTIAGDILLEMLERHTNLRELRLHHISCSPFILTRLSATGIHRHDESESKEILCPSLERLSVRFASGSHSQMMLQVQLQNIVSSRNSAGCPLSQLLFYKYRWGCADRPKDLVNTSYDSDDDDVQSRCGSCNSYH